MTAARPIFRNLYPFVLAGIALGVLVGVLSPHTGVAMKPLGDGFIKLIKMLIAPVIFSTVVVGIARLGTMSEVGRIGVRTLVYFEVVSTFALLIGLIVVNVLHPGSGIAAQPTAQDLTAIAGYRAQAEQMTTVQFLFTTQP